VCVCVCVSVCVRACDCVCVRMCVCVCCIMLILFTFILFLSLNRLKCAYFTLFKTLFHVPVCVRVCVCVCSCVCVCVWQIFASGAQCLFGDTSILIYNGNDVVGHCSSYTTVITVLYSMVDFVSGILLLFVVKYGSAMIMVICQVNKCVRMCVCVCVCTCVCVCVCVRKYLVLQKADKF